jgi:preprotein translocase SecE subunit
MPWAEAPSGSQITLKRERMPESKPASSVAPKPKNAVVNYISETISELKKVTWLKWPAELLYLSGIVLLVAIVCTIILGGIDFGFSEFVKWLITAVKGA